MSTAQDQRLYYESIIWVFGTTSLRPRQLSHKIITILQALTELEESLLSAGSPSSTWQWGGNNELQEAFYDLAKERGVVTGNAPRKAKDARVLTSGLVDLGLLTEERVVTDAGRELLAATESSSEVGEEPETNIFAIDRESFVYLKQLLKASLRVGESTVRPFVVVAKLLSEFGSLSYDEFCYLAQLITTHDDYAIISEAIRELRMMTDKQQIGQYIDDTIWRVIISKPRYQRAWELLKSAEESRLDEVIPIIVLNRKSVRYAECFAPLYRLLRRIYIEGDSTPSKITELYDLVSKSNSLKGWKQLLFKKGTTRNKVRKNAVEALCSHGEGNPFADIKDESVLRAYFFKQLHLIKTKATLKDYSDLNKRYIKLTNTILFENEEIKFDTLPRYIFREIAPRLFEQATFATHPRLADATGLMEVSDCFTREAVEVATSTARQDLGLAPTEEWGEVEKTIQRQRTEKFRSLVEERFDDKTLIRLLRLMEERKDDKIFELVTDEADIPTIFEYLVGVIWYRVSDYRGDILSFLKLSLDAELLPRTHAAGGTADIVYQYDAAPDGCYPPHTLLIEATLTDSTTQRSNEMEPVSRHLGNYIIHERAYTYISNDGVVRMRDQTAQSLFVATTLDRNVRNDFYGRRNIDYENDFDGAHVILDGTKIVGIDTKLLAEILRREVKYSSIYPLFESYFSSTDKSAPAYEELKDSIMSL